MKKVVIARVGGEIGIKSRPVRSIYERKIMKMIRSSLQRGGIGFSEIFREAGRIYILTDANEEAAKRVARIFGVSSTSAGLATSSELNDIVKTGTELAIKYFKSGTFAVKCRRSGAHTYTSKEVASILGESIRGLRKDLKVNLDCPDQTLYVEIRGEHAYLYLDVIRGPDGFPVGTQDLLLGIIDDTRESILASWCMMKRGTMLKAVTFEVDGVIPKDTKVNLRTLLEWTPNASLETTIVPLSICDEKLLRSYELGIAICLAKKEGIFGVVSGVRPTNIRALKHICNASVQVFFPLIALEDQMLDEWSRYIGLDPYCPDKGELVEKVLDEDFEGVLSGSRRVILSPKVNFF